MIELLIEDERGNKITHQLGEGRHTLGKSARSDVVLMDPHASRYHADLLIAKTGMYIIDMNSTNGIRVNGKRINKVIKIEHGDALTLGKLKLSTRVPRYNLYVRQGRKPAVDISMHNEATPKSLNIDEEVLRLLKS